MPRKTIDKSEEKGKSNPVILPEQPKPADASEGSLGGKTEVSEMDNAFGEVYEGEKKEMAGTASAPAPELGDDPHQREECPPPKEESGPGKISGKLVYARTSDEDCEGEQKPVSGVEVKLCPAAGNQQPALAPLKTDKEGHYSFTVEAGDWILETEVQPKALPNYRLSEPLMASIRVNVPPNTHIEMEDIEYSAQAQKVAAQGIVYLDKDGTGLLGHNPRLRSVAVALFSVRQKKVLETYKTDPQGHYLFTDLEPGVYLLKPEPEFDAKGSNLASGRLNLKTDLSKPIQFSPGQNISRDIAYSESAGEVHGVVFLDQDGSGHRFGHESGLCNVPVTLVDAKGKTLEARTDTCGEFLFPSVQPGYYTVRFTSIFQPPNQPGEYDLTSVGEQQIFVSNGRRAEVLAAGYSSEIHEIRGRALYENKEPIPGLVVTLTTPEGRFVDSVVTEQDGSYVFSGREGDFKVIFPDPPFSGQLLSRKELNVKAHSISDNNNAMYRLSSDAAAASFVTPTSSFASSIQESVGDIASYMPTMQGADWPGGGRATSRSGAAPLSQIVTGALTEVLGRKLKTDDPKAFIASLDRSFTSVQVNSRTEYKWTPRTYAVMTELGGGLSGAQASIYHRAKVALDDALPLLDGLYSLLPEFDAQETEAVRSIVHTEFEEMVRELGIEGGPRVQRVDDLFRILGLQLDRLEEEFGFTDQSRVNTVEEEQNLTNYFVVRDYIEGLQQAWKGPQGFRAQFTGKTKFLGTQLVLLARGLSVVAEQVDEAKLTMESVFLGPTERQTVRINFPAKIIIDGKEEDILLDQSEPLSSMLVSELLDWVERFATEEGPMLIQDGGRIGINSIEQTVRQLQRFVLGAAQANVSHIGFSRQRVRRSLEEMAAQLGEVAQLAAGVSLNK